MQESREQGTSSGDEHDPTETSSAVVGHAAAIRPMNDQGNAAAGHQEPRGIAEYLSNSLTIESLGL